MKNNCFNCEASEMISVLIQKAIQKNISTDVLIDLFLFYATSLLFSDENIEAEQARSLLNEGLTSYIDQFTKAINENK